MSTFPRISLKPEVADHLRSVFLNKEVLAAVGHQVAESRFQKLLTCLSHPPSHTCIRASTHLAPLEEIRHKLAEELEKTREAAQLRGGGRRSVRQRRASRRPRLRPGDRGQPKVHEGRGRRVRPL
uniref:NOP2/Sun RNA methyltransferase 6 n=1 Tax=Gasterosteus aculeatus aculeatus TaxID=481459 RepID=A0AAQ4S7I3_GASAC